LAFDEKVMIKDKDLYFCCNGCQGVYHLLHDEGLDSFYQKVGDTKLEPALGVVDGLQKYDHEGFSKKYIKEVDGFSQISLIIEGIHCSACVWLNEKILHKTDGILEADINYTNHKAKVTWDSDVIKLSEIIRKIQSIGYNAYPYDASAQEERADKARKDYYSRLLVAIFGAMNIMWLAIAQYTGYFTGITDDMRNVLNIAEFCLATPVLFYTGWTYFKGAYFGLKNRFINMDFLVITGATLAYIYSIYVMVVNRGEVYFDSVVMIITFVYVGKYLEVLSKKRAVDTLDSMTSTIPTEVIKIQDDEKKLVSIEEIEVGDILEIRSGEKIVIDGEILSGEGGVDESSMSGESEPVYKKVGDILISGTINQDSVIRYRATKSYNNSMLSTIVTLLEDSFSKKPKIEQLANEISGYFSLVILVLAVGTFIGWYIYSGEFEKSLIIAISVIVIACPCALALATPVATLIGLGVGAKRGVLFKEAGYLETMAKSDVLLLDKTGTITEGKPQVVKYEEFMEFDINLLYSLLKSSSHPISQGVIEFLESKYENLKEVTLENSKIIQARGIEASYQDENLFGGNAQLLRDRGVAEPVKSDNSIFAFVIDGEVQVVFELKDRVKEDAKDSIAYFKSQGKDVVMLTGDNERVASKIAKEVGIEIFHHSLHPQDKADIVESYHDNGKIVIMAGDGINDALALTKSDVAIAMGSGADVSVEVSDIVLMNDKMSSLEFALRLSQKTYNNIRQNLGLSLVYNVLTVPLAMAGFVIPLIAALSMSFSSLLVIANAVMIKRSFR
jgi:Cu+-exporting ATPase